MRHTNFESVSVYSNRWLDHFERHALAAAEMSKDSTKIGAALIGEDKEVLLTAFNGPGLGVEDTPERRNKRPMKYNFACHAEQNLVAFAARNGIKLKGLTVYTTHFPCANCANTLIQAGIKCVIVRDGLKGNTTQIADDSYRDANESFREAKVRLVTHDIDPELVKYKQKAKIQFGSVSTISRGFDFDILNAYSYEIPAVKRVDYWKAMVERFEELSSTFLKHFLEEPQDDIEYSIEAAWVVCAIFSGDVICQWVSDGKELSTKLSSEVYTYLGKVIRKFQLYSTPKPFTTPSIPYYLEKLYD